MVSGDGGSEERERRKRASVVLEESVSLDVAREKKVQAPRRAAGPPPPKLPEIGMLGARKGKDEEGGLGGGDMFKDIK